MIHQAKPEHEVAYQELIALINRHGEISSVEILAIAANMVGKLIAMQDKRTMTFAMVIEIVSKNIEHGNQQVLNELKNSKGHG